MPIESTNSAPAQVGGTATPFDLARALRAQGRPREGMEAAILGPRSHPYEDEYSPLQAMTIAGGAGMDNLLNQGKRIYYTGQKMLADRYGYSDTATAAQSNLDALAQQKAEANRLYRPMQDAYPYMSGIGESLPAVIGGPGALAPTLGFNLGKRYIGGLADQIQEQMPGTQAAEYAKKLAQALRKFQ